MGAFRRLCAPLAVRVVRGPGHVVVTDEPAQTVGTFVPTAHICAQFPSTAVTWSTRALVEIRPESGGNPGRRKRGRAGPALGGQGQRHPLVVPRVAGPTPARADRRLVVLGDADRDAGVGGASACSEPGRACRPGVRHVPVADAWSRTSVAGR